MSYIVYILHFATPLGNDRHHASHYIGKTKSLKERIAAHQGGYAARITQVCKERGIEISCVRTWNGPASFERYLKNRHDAKSFCPICSPNTWMKNGADPEFKAHHRPTTTNQEPAFDPFDIPERDTDLELFIAQSRDPAEADRQEAEFWQLYTVPE